MVFRSSTYSVLLLSASEKFNTATKQLLPAGEFWPVTELRSVSEARQRLVGSPFDIVIINSPLPDDPGTGLAAEICESSDAAVLLMVRSELYGDVYEKMLPSGVVTLARPTSLQLMSQTLRGLCAMRERLRGVRRSQPSVDSKIEEIRLVNRAKWLLIEKQGLSEDEAHHMILKNAMERRISKKAAAEDMIAELGE